MFSTTGFDVLVDKLATIIIILNTIATPAKIKKSTNEVYFDVITNLCERFPALSPFDLLERPTRDVFDLYIDAVIQADREGKRRPDSDAGAENESEHVYSWNATWH